MNISKLRLTILTSFILFFAVGCGHLLYYPSRVYYVDKEKLPIKPEEIHFQSRDGLKLVGWYFRSPKRNTEKPKRILLHFHGNAQNISSHFYSLYWVLQHETDYFIFDYPGYGGSEGEPDAENTVTAGLSAWDYLQNHFPETPIAIFGQSLGGAISLQTSIQKIASENRRPCLVAVESTFSSYKKVGQEVLAKNWFTWLFQPLSYILLSDKHAPKGQIEKIAPTPIVVIHGDQDPVVDQKLSHLVFSEALESKEFWSVPNGQHIDAFTGPNAIEYQKRLLTKLDQFCLNKN